MGQMKDGTGKGMVSKTDDTQGKPSYMKIFECYEGSVMYSYMLYGSTNTIYLLPLLRFQAPLHCQCSTPLGCQQLY